MKRKGLGRWIASALVTVLIVSNISISGVTSKTVYAGEESDNLFLDGDFGDDETGTFWENQKWFFGGSTWDAVDTVGYNFWAGNGTNSGLELNFGVATGTVSMNQVVSGLEAGIYKVEGDIKSTKTGGSAELVVGSGDAQSLLSEISTESFSSFVQYIKVSETADTNFIFHITSQKDAWVTLDNFSLSKVEVPVISNNDFETGDTVGWTIVGDAFGIDSNKNGNDGSYLNVWTSGVKDLSLTQTLTNAPVGTYTVSFKMVGDSGLETFAAALNGNALKVTSDGTVYTDKATIISDSTAWNTWTVYTTRSFYLEEEDDLTLTLSATGFSGWCALDDFSIGYECGDQTGSSEDDISKELAKAKTELNALITSVPDNYEEMQLVNTAALKTALTDAQLTYRDDAATLQQVQNCIDTLKSAIESIYLEDDDVFVEKISALTEDNIRGMDVSSYISIMDSFDEMNKTRSEDSKLGFKNACGQLISRQGFFDLLAANGVNAVRLRVWNDPYDEDANGYGGGNNDLEKAIEMGQYASNAGMGVLIDFHYSDFWADPEKQQAPKAWEDFSIDQKAEALSQYTTESLNSLLQAGVNVTMVQIGNETNGKFCSETDWDNMNVLFDAGCDAVHAVAAENSRTILAVLHFTNPEKAGKQMGYAEQLAAYNENEGVSYDVFASSYYPFWHGSLSNLKSVLSSIAKKYDKYVMVAETSYASSLEDTDGHDNTVKEGNNDTGEDLKWAFTEQGQINEFRDVLNTVVNSDVTLTNGDKAGLGVFWWEGAWIGLQDVYESDKTVNMDRLQENKSYWESCGSGWASSYAGSYDSKDAAKWYGGSAVDNQSFFAKDGTITNAIKVFNYNYLKYGAKTQNIRAQQSEKVSVSVRVKDTVDGKLPAKVTVLYNDGSKQEETVTWNKGDVSALQTAVSKYSGVGSYLISGTTNTSHLSALCSVTVEPVHLLMGYSFEDHAEAWSISENSGASITTDDPKSGQKSLHFWNAEKVNFTASQEVSLSQNGTYTGSIYAQGAAGTRVTLSLEWNGSTISENTVELNGWCNWVQPKVSFDLSKGMLTDKTAVVNYKVHVDGAADSWGTLDDAYFYLSGDAEDNAGSDDDVADKPVDDEVTDQPSGGVDVPDRPTVGDENDQPAGGDQPSGPDDNTESGTTTTQKVKTTNAYYTVTTKADGSQTASYKAPTQNAKKTATIKIPATIKVNGKNIKVTSVEEKAFYGNKKVKKVVLGKYIQTVERNTFKNCTALTSVTLNNNLTKIGDSAFYGCKKLAKLTITKNVTSIGSSSFRNCAKLKDIRINSSKINKIGKNAFKGIYKKATIKVPNKNYTAYKRLLNQSGLSKNVTIKK